MNRINEIGYGISCPLELIELTEAKRVDTIEAAFLGSLLCTLEGRRILDLCAGTGRLSIELVKRKAIVFALDGSHTMAQIIKSRTEQLPDSIKKNLTLIFGDACELDYPPGIDAAIISDGSVGYFYHDEDLREIFLRVFRSLKEDGLLVVYLFNKNERMKKDKVNHKGWIRSEYFDEKTKSSIIQYRRSTRMNDSKIVLTDYENFHFLNGQPKKFIRLKMRYRFFSTEEIKSLAEKIGFISENVFGSYEMDPISEISDYVMLFCKGCRKYEIGPNCHCSKEVFSK